MRFEDCRCKAASPDAIFVYIPDLMDSFWIPQSQVTDDSEVYELGGTGDLIVTEWWADKQGWS